MHSFKLIAMLGAYASASDLVNTNRRSLQEGDEYEGFPNVLVIAENVPICTDVACETPLGEMSASTSWNEQGSDDLTLYYGLILEFAFNEDAYKAAQANTVIQMGFGQLESDSLDLLEMKFTYIAALNPSF